MSEWTDDEISTLRNLWSTSRASEICAALPGRSRFAIIGKANRLGLPKIGADEKLRRIAEGLANSDSPRGHARNGGKYDPWRGAA